MKTLTTLTAVAALIAGMSIANAQTPSSSSMDKGATTKMAPAPKVAANNGKFCFKATAGGALDCKYASLADCRKVPESNAETCVANPKKATTGAK